MSTVETVNLAHREFGGPESGEPVVLLHGLLGSSRNWQGLARILAETHQVTGLDLRNHGSSPHHPIMDYPSMAADVQAWLDGRTVHLVGHSMGGKVAMQLACENPACIRSLTVVDIAPRAYPARWQREFAAMRRMPVERRHGWKRIFPIGHSENFSLLIWSGPTAPASAGSLIWPFWKPRCRSSFSKCQNQANAMMGRRSS